DWTSFAMSSFSRSMRSTIPPMGSSTSGIHRSSRSVTSGLWPFPRTPRDLGGGGEKDDCEQPTQKRLRDDLSQLSAADGGGRSRDPHDGSAAPANVPVPLLAPHADGDRGDDREQRRRLRVELRQAEPRQRRHEEDAAADPEEPREHARDDAEHDGERIGHFTRRSTAIPTRSAANARDSTRVFTRCCSAAPPTAPAAAGTPSRAA